MNCLIIFIFHWKLCFKTFPWRPTAEPFEICWRVYELWKSIFLRSFGLFHSIPCLNSVWRCSKMQVGHFCASESAKIFSFRECYLVSIEWAQSVSLSLIRLASSLQSSDWCSQLRVVSIRRASFCGRSRKVKKKTEKILDRHDGTKNEEGTRVYVCAVFWDLPLKSNSHCVASSFFDRLYCIL